VRCVDTLAAAAGAAMLAGSEYLRRKPDIAGAARSLAPPVLAGAGLVEVGGRRQFNTPASGERAPVNKGSTQRCGQAA